MTTDNDSGEGDIRHRHTNSYVNEVLSVISSNCLRDCGLDSRRGVTGSPLVERECDSDD